MQERRATQLGELDHSLLTDEPAPVLARRPEPIKALLMGFVLHDYCDLFQMLTRARRDHATLRILCALSLSTEIVGMEYAFGEENSGLMHRLVKAALADESPIGPDNPRASPKQHANADQNAPSNDVRQDRGRLIALEHRPHQRLAV